MNALEDDAPADDSKFLTHVANLSSNEGLSTGTGAGAVGASAGASSSSAFISPAHHPVDNMEETTANIVVQHAAITLGVLGDCASRDENVLGGVPSWSEGTLGNEVGYTQAHCCVENNADGFSRLQHHLEEEAERSIEMFDDFYPNNGLRDAIAGNIGGNAGAHIHGVVEAAVDGVHWHNVDPNVLRVDGEEVAIINNKGGNGHQNREAQHQNHQQQHHRNLVADAAHGNGSLDGNYVQDGRTGEQLKSGCARTSSELASLLRMRSKPLPFADTTETKLADVQEETCARLHLVPGWRKTRQKNVKSGEELSSVKRKPSQRHTASAPVKMDHGLHQPFWFLKCIPVLPASAAELKSCRMSGRNLVYKQKVEERTTSSRNDKLKTPWQQLDSVFLWHVKMSADGDDFGVWSGERLRNPAAQPEVEYLARGISVAKSQVRYGTQRTFWGSWMSGGKRKLVMAMAMMLVAMAGVLLAHSTQLLASSPDFGHYQKFCHKWKV
eukprot:TRINITY_DN854_c0_g2_i9.p1 TRINITY_DN854_c0_g2~~TRINITY_DN854_c0_g2_i9.p1  ORF type:complete len:497 (+),score=91.31 TRINITY_DN854_c0_g2_i9:364-1854(+)